MKELAWNRVLSIAKKEYIRWITDSKCILFPVLLIPIRELIILPMLQAASQMNQPIGILEPCIALANSGLIVLLLPFAYLTLMADFPCIDGNMLFLLSRTGRKNWIVGEIVFQWLSLVTYLVLIVLSTMLQVGHIAYMDNAWSFVVTDYAVGYDAVGMSSLIPPNLYFQMTPLFAFMASYALLFISLLLWSGILLLGSLYGKKLITYWIVLCSIVAGIGMCSIGTSWKWCFPISHSILWIHYQEYYRKYLFSPWISFFLFGGTVLIVYWGIWRKGKTLNTDSLSQSS